MRKTNIYKKLILCLVGVIVFMVLLNIKVTTRQGIDYSWYSVKIPLYLKTLDFIDRHCNYAELVKRILDGKRTDEERVMRLFEWTIENIKRVPEGLPVVDDHIWYTMIRGYATRDQFCDILATLCNYAKVEALIDSVCAKGKDSCEMFVFVRFSKSWYVFDPYMGVCFKDDYGRFADIGKLKKGEFNAYGLDKKEIQHADYSKYFENLPTDIKSSLKRSNMQSPLKRVIFEIEKWMQKK